MVANRGQVVYAVDVDVRDCVLLMQQLVVIRAVSLNEENSCILGFESPLASGCGLTLKVSGKTQDTRCLGKFKCLENRTSDLENVPVSLAPPYTVERRLRSPE